MPYWLASHFIAPHLAVISLIFLLTSGQQQIIYKAIIIFLIQIKTASAAAKIPLANKVKYRF
ncbi:MAG: hypothetical protein D3923_17540 [Candidatus Electrothrix sp. AR3]|nr:hypothetical protein [Candidatus Electrothrix sp. AR3]